MKRKQSLFSMLILVTFLMMTGCAPPEENQPEESVISQAPEPSPDPSSSAAELPESSGDPEETSVADDKDIDDGSINTQAINAAIQERLETVEEGTYVIHGSLSDTEHVELLDKWVACFQAGEPAPPLYVFHHGYGLSNGLRLLEYEGGSHYTLTDYFSGESWESAVIVKRAVDYVFGTDLPRDEYVAKAITCIIRHTPFSAEPLEYNLETTPALGGITAEEACKLAILQNSNWPSYSGYAGGLWMSNGWEPRIPVGEEPVDGTTVAAVTGAVELMGMPCYRITVEWEMVNGFPAGNNLAVSADGRLIYSDHKMISDGYSLSYDFDEQYIAAAH